jgi:hypothetical protein
VLERGFRTYSKSHNGFFEKRTLDKNDRIDRKGAKDVFMFNLI